MTALLVEGWDHEASPQTPTPSGWISALSLKGWILWDEPAIANQRILNIGTGRGGGQAFIVDQPAQGFSPYVYVYKFLESSTTTCVLGFAFKPSTEFYNDPPGELPTFPVEIFAVGHGDGNNIISSVFLNSSGALSPDGTTYGAPVITLDAWHYIEYKVVISGASSTVELQVDGVSYVSPITLNLGTNPVTTVGPYNQKTNHETFFYYDDIYVNDTAFLGDSQVITLYPAADGDDQDWTADIGGPHYSRVNEHPPDGDASYVYDNTPGDKDSYDMDTLSPSLAVFAAQLSVYGRKQEAGTRTIAPLVRQGGTDYVGPTTALSTSYAFHSWLLTQDPTGADWTRAQINADEFGMELIA